MAVFVASKATDMSRLPEFAISSSHDPSRTVDLHGSNPDVQLTLTQGATALVVRGDIRFDPLIAIFDLNGSIYGPVNYLQVQTTAPRLTGSAISTWRAANSMDT